MKILFFSDLHEHNYQEFSELKDGLNSRMLDGLTTMKLVEADAKASKVNAICFGGDVFHLKNFVDSQVIWHTIKAFESLAQVAPIYMCAGNHDYKNWGKDPVLVEALSGLVDNIHFEEVVDLGGWNLFVFNYKRNLDELQALLNHWKADDHSIGLFHQDVIGSRYGGIEVMKGLDAKQLSEKFRWSFVGHYHTPRQYAPNVFSIGSPLAHNFSDIGEEHGWWILDTDKETATFKPNTEAPHFIDVELTEKELAGPSIAYGRPDIDFFRIRSHSRELSEDIKSLKWKRISFVEETAAKERGSLKFSDNLATLVTKYVEARNTTLDSERLIEMGKHYIGWSA